MIVFEFDNLVETQTPLRSLSPLFLSEIDLDWTVEEAPTKVSNFDSLSPSVLSVVKVIFEEEGAGVDRHDGLIISIFFFWIFSVFSNFSLDTECDLREALCAFLAILALLAAKVCDC